LFSSNKEILSNEWYGKKGNSKYYKDYSRIVLGEKKKKEIKHPAHPSKHATSKKHNIIEHKYQ